MVKENKQSLQNLLKDHFGYDSFRQGQEEIITDIMNGKSVLGVLPTGTGKSICYQLPALIKEGLTIVVSPLISLMIDQVNQLKKNGIKKVASLNSFIHYEEREYVLKHLNQYKLLYISPELLKTNELLEVLKHIQVSLLVIDEAHCISQWGHEFRPDFLELGVIRNQLNKPPVLALTATATEEVRTDIVRILEMDSYEEYIFPVDRPNIAHIVKRVPNGDGEKIEALKNMIDDVDAPTIIYFSNRRLLETITRELEQLFPNKRIAPYHGEMESIDRLMIQQQFINDELDLICCTSAFGMGIDKPNIRFVIHYHFSKDMESYIQEFGRAGRDGQQSLSVVLFSEEDIERAVHLTNHDLPSNEHLHTIFTMLRQMALQNRPLPANQEEAEAMFQLSDVQWRFLYYQFKKHGMIKHRKLIYHDAHWKSTFLVISRHLDNRRVIKRKKLIEMIHWLNEQDCLRSAMYTVFDSTFKPIQGVCCSNCGFQLEQFHPKVKRLNKVTDNTWEEKLQKKLQMNDIL